MMNQQIQGGAYGPTQSREVLQSNFQDFQGSHPKTQVKNERNVPQNKFILEQISNDPHFVQRQADMKLVMRNPLFHEFHYNKLVEPQYVAPQHKDSFNKDHEREAADSLDIFKNNYEARQVNLDRAKVGSNLMNYDLGSQSQQPNIPGLQGQQQQFPPQQQQRLPSMQMRQDQNQYQPQEQRRTGNSRHLRASSSLVSLTNNSILNQNNNPQPQYEQYPQQYQPNSYPDSIPNQQQQQTYLPQQVLNYEDLQQQPDQQQQQQQLLQQQVRSPQTQQYQQFQPRTPSQVLQQSQLRTSQQQLQSKMRSPLLLQANNLNNNSSSNIFQARPGAIPNSRGNNNNNVPSTQYDSLMYQQQLLQQESQLLKQQQMQLEQQQQLLQQQSYQQQQAQNPGGQIAALGIQGSAAPQQYQQSQQIQQQPQQLGQQYLEDQGIDQQFVSQGQQQQQQPLRNSQKLPSRYATPSILSDKHLKKIYNPLNQKVQAIYEPRYDIKVNWDMLERDQFRNFQGRTEPFNEIIRLKNNALEMHPDYSTVNQEYGLRRLR